MSLALFQKAVPHVTKKFDKNSYGQIPAVIRDMCSKLPQEATEFIYETFDAHKAPKKKDATHSGLVILAKGDTLECVRRFLKKNKSVKSEKCLVLNFANAYRPGGGWKHGSRAQEEMLFFRSSYHVALEAAFNEISRKPYLTLDNCVITPHVFVWGVFHEADRSIDLSHPSSSSSSSEFMIQMLAAAAPDYRGKPKPPDGKIQKEMGRLWETIFRAAIHQGVEHFFVGPIGCGVFVPSSQAYEYRQVAAQVLATKIEKYRKYFHSIVFVDFVPDRNYDNPQSNYQIFSQAITEHVDNVVCDYCNDPTCDNL
jgi:uncharacterized protein (TIGR02452 family)